MNTRCLSVNSPELLFGLFRVRARVRIRVNSVTETNMMTETIKRTSNEYTRVLNSFDPPAVFQSLLDSRFFSEGTGLEKENQGGKSPL